MSLRARVALWAAVVALLTSSTLTALFAADASRARSERLRAEGRRIAFSAVTLYDVLRLTGSEADRATLQAFLNAAVRGTSDEAELAWAVVVDDKGVPVAASINERNAPPGTSAAVIAHNAASPAPATTRGIVEIDAAVIARDAAKKAPDVEAGRVLVGLSTAPAERALLRTVAVGGAASALIALAFAGALAAFVTRRVVRPMRAVVHGMGALATALDGTAKNNGDGSGAAARIEDAAVAPLVGRDEAAQLVDGFNDMVGAIAAKQGALDRHLGKKLAREVSGNVAGAGRPVHVTALFLDVEGFTTREGRDAPESVVAFLHELVGACVDIVAAHEGHVARIFGDNLLALWGVPDAHADDPARAVAAALALHDKCRALSDARRAKNEEPFDVGIGVATGDAVLATVGTRERAESVVVGEPVALARRIEEEAKATSFGVLVSEETFRAVSSTYEGAATPPVLVRGFGVPLTLYRVRPRRAP